MNPTAELIAILYGAVVGIAVLILIAVWWSTHHRGRVDRRVLAEREKTWFGIAVVLLAVLLFATILFTPYGASSSPREISVSVVAQQFAWSIRPAAIPAGRPVRFVVRSRDVNHGFGVYNDAGTLLFQVQVVPDRDTVVRYTFKKPGTYQVLCLEFCGLNHHAMEGSFRVAAS
jgi:cytochrome c oxidase subunit 2